MGRNHAGEEASRGVQDMLLPIDGQAADGGVAARPATRGPAGGAAGDRPAAGQAGARADRRRAGGRGGVHRLRLAARLPPPAVRQPGLPDLAGAPGEADPDAEALPARPGQRGTGGGGLRHRLLEQRPHPRPDRVGVRRAVQRAVRGGAAAQLGLLLSEGALRLRPPRRGQARALAHRRVAGHPAHGASPGGAAALRRRGQLRAVGLAGLHLGRAGRATPGPHLRPAQGLQGFRADRLLHRSPLRPRPQRALHGRELLRLPGDGAGGHRPAPRAGAGRGALPWRSWPCTPPA